MTPARVVATLALAAVGATATPRTASADVIRVRPGEDLQEALEGAPAGGTIELSAGRHRGPVRVSHRLTIRGVEGALLEGNGQGSVLTLEGNGVRVERLRVARSGHDLSDDDAGVLVLGDDVHVEGVRVQRALHGIYVRGGKRARILDNEIVGLAATGDAPRPPEADAPRDDGIHHNPRRTRALMGNGIHLWNTDGSVVARNHVHHARDGIYVAHSNQASFLDNRVHHSRYGIHYMYSHHNELRGNELWRNVAGAALMFSRDLEVTGNVLRDHGGFRAYGLLLQDVDGSTFRANHILANRVGMRLQNTNANTFVDNRVFANITGMRMGSASRDNTFTRNHIAANLHPVELTGPVPPTRWSVDGVGNYWDGAVPLDLTGDGISEWPHHEVDLLAEKRETFPPLQLLAGSAGIRWLQWAVRRAPVPGMRYITDPDPLTVRWGDD
ncbi:MAG: NosD domain-containing protein [Myxococcota bacterium]